MTIARAINQIALNAIGRSYGLEPSSSKTTTTPKVLDAIATDAANRKDWPKLRKVINSIQSLGTNIYLDDPDAPKLHNDPHAIDMILTILFMSF